MQRNTYDRNCTFEDLLPCYCYVIKSNDRTIHSQALQHASDVVETVTSETDTWKFETETGDLTFL